MGGEADALDPEVLREMVAELGEEVAMDIVASFLDEGRRLSAQILEAARAGDAETARRAAHALKGSALAVGANRLAEACRSFEASEGAVGMAGAMEIEVLMERSSGTLETWKSEAGSP